MAAKGRANGCLFETGGPHVAGLKAEDLSLERVQNILQTFLSLPYFDC